MLSGGKAVQPHSPVPGPMVSWALYFFTENQQPYSEELKAKFCVTLPSKLILQKFGIYQKRLIESQQYCTSKKKKKGEQGPYLSLKVLKMKNI